MKRVFALIFILLISLSLVAMPVKAEQVEHLGFEGFGVHPSITSPTDDVDLTGTTSYKLLTSYTLALSSPKYLAGQKLVVYSYAMEPGDPPESVDHTLYVKVVVNGITAYEGSVHKSSGSNATFYIRFTNIPLSDTYTVEIYARMDQSYYRAEAHVESAYDYTINEETGGIKSKLEELKYIPPGAENTAQGLILNQTEVYLKQSYTLPEGSISFWLLDGHQNLRQHRH